MAEMLIAVAILTVLLSVAFVGVIQYMRRMAQLERDGFAKEIFVAAQNHLVMAHEQGYLGVGTSGYGTAERTPEGDGDETTGVYYFTVTKGDAFNKNTILDQMLPFAAVDETVRVGGSFIVRYHPETATVMDVFYCAPDGARYGHSLQSTDYSTCLSLMDTVKEDGSAVSQKTARRNVSAFNGAVLGWYGGAEAAALEKGSTLKAPLLEVINAEKLKVRVTDPNAKDTDASLVLILTGKTSGNKVSIPLSSIGGGSVAVQNVSSESDGSNTVYTIILDDITTAGLHFSELFCVNDITDTNRTGPLTPGEDITIQAVAYSSSTLTNIAYSAEKTTNSLFADPDGSGDILVGNIRHLENLSSAVSGAAYDELKKGTAGTTGTGSVTDSTAAVPVRQITDLDWKEFLAAVDSEGEASGVSIYETAYPTASSSDSAVHSAAGTFLPVNPEHAFSYDGQNHTITGIKAEPADGDAGLFGSLTGNSAGSRVSNLMLSGFSIETSDGNAGALAGSAESLTVYNVAAVGAGLAGSASGSSTGTSSTMDITASGNAGGLVGSMKDGSVSASAAALLVTSTGADAGGLIGKAENTAITSSYSAGHTKDGLYSKENMNVTAPEGNAGGLVGSYSGSGISASYSTCSTSGKTSTGGLVGSVSGASITNSYAAGLVQAVPGSTAAEGALFGGFTNSTVSGCSYFEIVNERKDSESGVITYLASGAGSGSEAAPFDLDLDSYRKFTGEDRKDALAYDPVLIRNYQGDYSLAGFSQLGSNLDSNCFVNTHYGDWPSPEILFMNEPEG